MEGLSGRTERMVDFVRMKWSEVESRKRKMDAEVWEFGCRRESLEKWERELEERERVFSLFEKRRKWELARENEELRLDRTRFRMGEEELDRRIAVVNEDAKQLEAAKAEVRETRRRASERLKNIEADKESSRLERESLAEREKKVDARITAVEKKEEEFNLFREGKLREINLKEENLDKKLEEFAEKVRVWVQDMLKHRFMDGIEYAEIKVKMDERFEGNGGCESLALRLEGADLIMESVEKKLEELENMRTEFTSFQEEKNQELASKEQQLEMMSEQLVKDVQLRNEQLTEREVLGHRLLERLEMAKDDVEGMKRSCDERFQETCLKIRELASKEQLIEVRSKEVFREAELKNEEWIEREKFGLQLLERLELAKGTVEGLSRTVLENYRKIGLKETELDSRRDLVEKKMDEADLKESEFNLKEGELKEQEKLGRRHLEKLKLAKDDAERMTRRCDERVQELRLKIRELASKEQLLDVRSKEVFSEAELRNEEWIEREKSGHQLLERLEFAKETVEGLNRTVLENYRKIGLKETELDSLRDWVEKKMDEADLKESECKEREQKIAEKEAHLISKETELQEMGKYLCAWQKELEDERKEVYLARKSNVQKSEKLDFRERNLNSVREFTRKCFKEHRDKKRKLKTEQDLVEKRAIELDLKEQHLDNALKDIELREKQMEDSVKLLEQLQQSPKIFNTPLMIEPDDFADLKFVVRMDGKTLQMFINDAEKDMKTMGDEIFKVLRLSSDPAKLVLDAMEGFYPPHLRKEDVEFNVRRTCITLLEQLTKMSPEIKPNVREEAIEVASSWKSKLGANVQTARSLEVLGFLFLLSAYDLFSYFYCDEVASLLMMVDQHKETAELLYVLGYEMEQ